MIPDQWYPIYSSRQLRRGRRVAVRRLGKDLVLWRDPDGALACLPDRCVHRGAQLSQGKLRGDCIECPYHGLRYDRTGAVRLIPANGSDCPVPNGFHLTPPVVREEHGLIWLWFGRPRSTYPAIPWFAEAMGTGHPYTEAGGVIPVNYLRVCENFGDLHHFPFVHRSINPGLGSRFDEVKSSVSDDRIDFSAVVRHDGAPRRPDARGVHLRLAIRMPCLLIIPFTSKMQLIASATPVDETHTWLFARYLQSYLRVPLLGRLLVQLVMLLDWTLAQKRQDLPIWLGQSRRLPHPDSFAHYTLFPADAAVAHYFETRRKLLAAAEGDRVPAAPAADADQRAHRSSAARGDATSSP